MENSPDSMIAVYDLHRELQADPEQIRLAQALSLNSKKPEMGLRATHGLFGSSEWWESIKSGRIPQKRILGTILRPYRAGQEYYGPNNTVDIVTDDGSIEAHGIYVNDPEDVKFFKIGHNVEIIYILDELKNQPAPDGSINYLEIALKMYVSTEIDARR